MIGEREKDAFERFIDGFSAFLGAFVILDALVVAGRIAGQFIWGW